MTDRICVGAIAGSFGVTGEVRLKSFCAEPAAIADYAPLYTEDGSQEFTVNILRPINNGFAVHLSGIKTKEQADALKGISLFADRDKLPSLPDDEYYHTDLIGLTVIDTGGKELGKVVDVLNHGSADLLEIRAADQSDTVLLPFTQAAIPTVDLTAGRIIADPPEGIFPEGDG
jgi:16S rRNA processing protein RimM